VKLIHENYNNDTFPFSSLPAVHDATCTWSGVSPSGIQKMGSNNLTANRNKFQTKNWQPQPQSTGGNDANLDRIARFHRSSAGKKIHHSRSKSFRFV
jgi:hypothetical protein